MRFQSVQVLRGLAASAVVLLHAGGRVHLGAVGVDIFFVISGFIIARMMFAKSAGAFLRDRLLRIYPIYWVAAVPTAILAWNIGEVSTARTLTSLTLWPVFGGDYLQPYLVLGWTLSFEMLFYACATAVLIERRALWLLLAAYPMAMWGGFVTGAPILRFIGNPLIVEFLLGVLIAWRGPANMPRLGLSAIIVAIVLLSMSDAARLYLPLGSFEFTTSERPIVWGIPAALLVWGGLQFERFASDWRFLPYLGDASYSIYLFHGVGAWAAAVLLWWPLKLVAAIALGIGVHHWIEKPMLRALRRIVPPKPIAAAAFDPL